MRTNQLAHINHSTEASQGRTSQQIGCLSKRHLHFVRLKNGTLKLLGSNAHTVSRIEAAVELGWFRP